MEFRKSWSGSVAAGPSPTVRSQRPLGDDSSGLTFTAVVGGKSPPLLPFGRGIWHDSAAMLDRKTSRGDGSGLILPSTASRQIWITSMPSDPLFPCRVCGLLFREPPWGENGKSPTFEICPCCGVEFGYEDCNAETCRAYRSRWIAEGANWWDKNQRPESWNLDAQLCNVPQAFA